MTPEQFSEVLHARDASGERKVALDKLGFSHEFITTNVLSADGTVSVSRTAMLWQGMPNKHDRKRTRQLFDILSEMGLLAPTGDDETWAVLAQA